METVNAGHSMQEACATISAYLHSHAIDHRVEYEYADPTSTVVSEETAEEPPVETLRQQVEKVLEKVDA